MSRSSESSAPVVEVATSDDSAPSGNDHAYRILIVDDNSSIHDDFRRILQEADRADDSLDELAEVVLGVSRPRRSEPRLRLDSAFSGREALAQITAASNRGEPYALAFIDVRMPPGWNGIETTARVLDADEDIHIVVCTAYANTGWQRRVEELPSRDRVLVLKKPFAPIEVRQLANALCEKWELAIRNKRRLQTLEDSVTEQKGALREANAHLRKEIAERTLAESQLRKAQRLEGLGSLAAGLCHEINNPLSFIVGGAAMLNEDVPSLTEHVPRALLERVVETLDMIDTGAQRITQIVRNIKLFARQNDEPADLVDVDEVIATAVKMVEAHIPSHIEVSVSTTPTPAIIGRRIELEQVLINLMENAIHAMSPPSDRPGRLVIGSRVDSDGHVVVTVSDTGPGIDKAVIDQIFDPFFTTKPVDKGTGLGLSICHSLISGMGGSIDVRSDSDGTVFLLQLPGLSAGKTIPRPPTGRGDDVRAATGRRGKLLVIDDEPFVLRMLERVLHMHDVTCVPNARDALNLCVVKSFDLILCDIMMPELSGVDFYKMLAHTRPGSEQRVVFITGGMLIASVREFVASVPNLCIEKPFDGDALRTLIAETIDRRAEAEGAGQ